MNKRAIVELTLLRSDFDMFASYLQRNALARRAGERGESLDSPAGDEGLVAPVNLGHSLLDQRNPKLIPFCLKESMTLLYFGLERCLARK